jgi:signal transduction histidine kinase
MGQRVQLAQLFQNLIGNAIKFRRDVPPLIRIIATDAADGFAQFTVEDNGIGIDKEHLERAFVIFQRLHDREKYSGTGIGLAIVKKVVEHHGGRVWIESEVGRGSRFRFTLPVAKEAGAPIVLAAK